MTFYEQELRKIVGERYPDATYVGRACYVRLSDMNRAKIQFVTGIVANQYNALQLTILNRSEGQVDTLRLRFSDLLGTKATSNPNFRNGVDPHIWDDYGKVCCPSSPFIRRTGSGTAKVDWAVDYVITHCAPTSIALMENRHNEADPLTDFLQEVKERAHYHYWLFGHYHDNRAIDEKHILLWDQIIQVI